MNILAIDPGPTQSAYLVLEDGKPTMHAKVPTGELLKEIRNTFGDSHALFAGCDHLAIEMVQSFGMSVGQEIFETVLWTGRMIEAWPRAHSLVYRKDVKMHFCHSMRAKDSNIRTALIDRFGGESAIGRKAAPGPLYGISGDVWSALAIAVYFADTTPVAAQ